VVGYSSIVEPVFKKTLVNEGQARARILSDRLFTLLLIVLSVVVLLGAIFASTFVYLAAEGFAEDPVKFELTVSLTRWMFPYLLFISLASLLMGVLNSYGKFGIPAFASSMFNLGMIFSMLFLYDTFELPVYSLVVGVLVGGVGQFAIQLPSLYRAGHRLRLNFDFRDDGLKAVGRLMAPMMIGLSASRVNILVSSLLASLQGPGAVSYLVYAYQLMHFPLGVFGLAIGTVALPKASEQVARGEFDGVRDTLISALRMIIFLVTPSAVYLALFNSDLIRLIYQRGAFGAEDSASVSIALFWYSVGLLAFAGVRVVTPVFYALSDARTPMRISFYTVAVNIVLSLLFVYAPFFDMGFPGLAAATSIAGWLNLFLLIVRIKKRLKMTTLAQLTESLSKTVLASALMALALYFASELIQIESGGIVFKVLAVGIEIFLGGLVYLALTLALGLREPRRALARFRRWSSKSKEGI